MHVARPTFAMLCAATALLLSACDSTKPLSGPLKATADPRVSGAWQGPIDEAEDGDDSSYCYIGRHEKFPPGVLYGVWLMQCNGNDGSIIGPVEVVVFPSKVGGKDYLNVGEIAEEHRDDVAKSGFKPEWIKRYSIFQYRIERDAVVLNALNGSARESAIESGKVKGVKQEDSTGELIDVESEKLASFVAADAAKLFSKKGTRYERIEPPSGEKKR